MCYPDLPKHNQSVKNRQYVDVFFLGRNTDFIAVAEIDKNGKGFVFPTPCERSKYTIILKLLDQNTDLRNRKSFIFTLLSNNVTLLFPASVQASKMTVEGPDQIYSLVILLCCAYIHFALFGLFRSWGVIYVAVLQDYNVTREEASWPFSLCSAVFQLIGPAVSILTHYVSTRSACLLGCTIATIGVVGCYFAENVMWITIFYGVIHGIGLGIVITLIPVFLTQYFVKYRAIAIGISLSGTSIGSFVVPLVTEWLLKKYELKGSFLLLGGMVMKTLVYASLLRPPPWLSKSKITASKLLEVTEVQNSGVSTSGVATNDIKVQVALPVEHEYEFQDSEITDGKNNENDNTSIADISQLDSSKLEDTSENQDTIVSNVDSMAFESSMGEVYVVTDSNKADKNHKNGNSDKMNLEVQKTLMIGNVMYIKPKSKKRKFRCVSIGHSIAEILRNPMFHLIAFSMFILYLALQNFFVVIVDYAKDKGIPENYGIYLMSMYSFTDLVGRAGLGWITDCNFVKRKNLVILNLFYISVIMHLYPVISNFTGLLIVAAFHGISTGSCITLFFVLQAEYLGVKGLTLVVGLTSFINGALILLRPSLIGMFRDTVGSYDWLFHSLGIVFFVFGLLWIAESWWTRGRFLPNQS